MSGSPLDGLIVLDLSRVLAGPFATMRLADLGARVIKIESEGGDPTRGFGPPFTDGESSYFLAVNRGKESVILNLADPVGREVVLAIAARADVVIHNFRPGVMDKLGLSDARLEETNDRLVRCAIVGYGPGDSRESLPAFDLAIQAESGLMSITGEGDGAPVRVGISLADIAAGSAAIEAILAALLARVRTGKGSNIRIALIEALAAWFGYQAQTPLLGGPDPVRMGSAHPNLAPYQAFATADGHIILAIGVDAQWRSFIAIEGMPVELDRREWRSNAGRVEDRERLIGTLRPLFRARTTETWRLLLDHADVPHGRTATVAEMLAESAPGYLVEVAHRKLGAIRMVGSPIIHDGVRHVSALGPPVLGDATESVIKEFAPDTETAERWCRAARRERNEGSTT